MTWSFVNGQSISVPLAWYPRLQAGTSLERECYELIGDGEGIHWPDLDEDISAAGILAGKKSMESRQSFSRWSQQRLSKKGQK